MEAAFPLSDLYLAATTQFSYVTALNRRNDVPRMTSKSLAHLFADLGVTQSRSRPHVSTTIPTSSRISKPSSTARPSPTISQTSNRHAISAADSSSGLDGTTSSIGTTTSHCSRPRTSSRTCRRASQGATRRTSHAWRACRTIRKGRSRAAWRSRPSFSLTDRCSLKLPKDRWSQTIDTFRSLGYLSPNNYERRAPAAA